MFNNSPQPPTHLPLLQGSPTPEPQLPRGECAFILPDHDPETGARQRCTCRSFYPDHVVRSRCGCGHQAWHHEAQPLSSVSMEEHMALVEEVKRLRQEFRRIAKLKNDLQQECNRREEMKQMWNHLHQRQYMAMRDLKLHFDDKVEAVIDKSQDVSESLKTLHAKVINVEDSTFELDTRIERLEHGRGWQSRSLTPLLENSLESSIEKPMILDPPSQSSILTIHQLPFRTEKKIPQSWSARVIFVPSRSQTHAFEHNSVGMKRCQSRNLQQDVTFAGLDSNAFVSSIESHFKHALRNRPWVPLTGYRPEDEPFGRIVLKQLPVHIAVKENWDHSFVDRQCVVHDKMQGDLLFISLEHDSLSWVDVRFLPAVPGSDESCWERDEELDGGKEPGYKSLDSELMYESLEPPPYSSRTHSEMDRLPSRLDMLAHASSMLPQANRARSSASLRNTQSDTRSVYSDVHSISERSISDISFSGRSVSTADLSDDEHRDKKVRMKGLPSLAGPSTSSSSMYVSGRSKRKMPSNGKMKEPVHWGVESLTRPLHAIRKNRSVTKEKVEAAQS